MASDDDELVWEDPPNNRVKVEPSVFDGKMQEIKKQAGKWARIRLYSTSGQAHGARKRLIASHAARDARWEITVSRLDHVHPSGYGLYVRYRSEEQMEPTP